MEMSYGAGSCSHFLGALAAFLQPLLALDVFNRFANVALVGVHVGELPPHGECADADYLQ